MKLAKSYRKKKRPNRSHLPSTKKHKHWLVTAAVIASSASTGSAAISNFIPGHVNNYSECVIRQLQPATGTLEIEAIVGDCREQYPQASRRNMLDPRSVQSCYQRHQKRVAHRPAAEALFVACQDYFRQS